MCGNWGLLCLAEFAQRARQKNELFPAGLENLLVEMLEVVELRGAQAAGVSLIAAEGPSCRTRVLKPKRGDLAETLFRKFKWELKRRSPMRYFMPCIKSVQHEPILLQGHSRFGTSSAPALCETHPHQWSPQALRKVWRWDASKGWTCSTLKHFMTVTHNGDFDAWKPYGTTIVDVGYMGLWLSRVLGVSNPSTGDSAKIAGVMELLSCQGIWFNAVRYAYHLQIACHVEQASGWTPLAPDAPSTVPSTAALKKWADVFNYEFSQVVEKDSMNSTPLDPGSSSLEAFVDSCLYSLQEHADWNDIMKWIPAQKLRHFVMSVVEGFRDHDLLSATTVFLRRAEGSFGLTVASSACPGRIVLAAKGQPMSVGFGSCSPEGNGPAEMVCWSSEAAAIGSVSYTNIDARLDLDDRLGEALEVSVTSLDAYSFPVFLDASEGSVSATGSGVVLRGLHFGLPVAEESWTPELLTADRLGQRLIWLPRRAAPKQKPQARKKHVARDIVQEDLSLMPYLVYEIDHSWADKRSMNSQSGRHFSELLSQGLQQNAKLHQPNKPQCIDLLVFGVETSYWLAQQFCADLKRMFPTLNAVAMSSNLVLGLLQKGPAHMNAQNWTYAEDSFHISQHTVGFAISHSGTTYSTVWAARCLREHTDNVFSMSSTFDCLLAASIGQASSQVFSQRLFSTLAGIRPAEAASAATIAMHHTLSHLLLLCAAEAAQTHLPSLRHYSREDIVWASSKIVEEHTRETDSSTECPSESTSACSIVALDSGTDGSSPALSPATVRDMQRLLLSLYWNVSAACGIDKHGLRVAAPYNRIHDELLASGRRWSHHITEGYWATFLPGAYVALTVTTGLVPAISIGTYIYDYNELEMPPAVVWLLRGVDALIYMFLGIIVAMIHRWCTGRRVWARFTTRTVMLVESTVNYKILRAYVSKLVALSWRFATVSVAGQNGTDHFVHEYTHKAQSDTLVAVGLPDGRLPSTASQEAYTLLSVQQAKFIKKTGRGVEPICLGHNSWTRPGLFTHSMKLPANRPVFASESLLFSEQEMQMNHEQGRGYGLPPTEVMLRWKDLLVRHMDPAGLPGLRMSFDELIARMRPRKTLDFALALEVLTETVVKQGSGTKAAQVPVDSLNLHRFLEQYSLRHPSVQSVFVHSPAKAYASAEDWYASPASMPACDPMSPSSDLGIWIQDPDTRLPAGAHTPRTAFRRDLHDRLDSPAGANKSILLSSAPVPDQQKSALAHLDLDLNAFLAMLHGDELQEWIKARSYRWNKIRTVRGVLADLALFDYKQSANVAVLSQGVTMGQVFRSWRKVNAKPPESRNKTEDKPAIADVQTALQMDADRRHSRRRVSVARLPQDSSKPQLAQMPDANAGKMIGQHLLDQDMDHSELLNAMKITENFHEARVASAERLVAWFVFFHAMAKPSSRLPFLGFDLGRSESRLRVASTPAPVAMHGIDHGTGKKQKLPASFSL
eukprot:TRINITY_DN839_c0_g1_i3.p1 TRINITY_DN839_c0_g1~~TRINITY_DN839_c0_g1_i3.p1  ORF type:complete len:1466 (+),score=253.31 TRINITY_DN839_c0_g1_i3:175-4572(+)